VGIDLVKYVVARCGRLKLSGNAYKVLVAMAATALDQPNSKGQPARLYYAGWEPLALALGFDPQENPRKAKEAVRRAIKELREAGLVCVVGGHARTGNRQSYRLDLDAVAAVSWAPDLDLRTPDLGDQEGPQVGGNRAPNLGAPRTHIGPSEDLPQDSLPPVAASATGHARAEVEQHAFVGNPGDDCESCGLGYANRLAHPRGAA
jgi:hypothetical protein